MDAAASGDLHWTNTRQRTAKSCGPGAATLALRWQQCLQRGQERPLPWEITYKPSNHCAGKAGMSRLYLSNPCAFFYYPLHAVLWAQPAPGLPCALCSRREQRIDKTQAKSRRENEQVCSLVIARSEATKQSSFLAAAKGSWIASRSLSSGRAWRGPVGSQ